MCAHLAKFVGLVCMIPATDVLGANSDYDGLDIAADSDDFIWGGGSDFTRDWVSVGPEGVKGVQPEIPNADGGHGGDAINDGEFADQEAEDEDNREL